MSTIERGAVYGGGFRCDTCMKIYPSMFGDTCNSCKEIERRHQEIVAAIKLSNDLSKPLNK